MTILEILKGAVGEAQDWVDKLKTRVNWPRYLWVSRVNNFLQQLSSDQINLLQDKFKNISDDYLLRDKLVEILVATEYQDEKPQFLSDNSREKTPDIFLKKSGQYIEVKNFNNSNEYKTLLEKLRKDKEMYLERSNTSVSKLKIEDEKRYELILKYAKEQIDGGVKQLSKKDGFICFVYSIDSSPFSLNTVDEISTHLERDIQKHYSQQKNKVVCKGLSQLFE